MAAHGRVVSDREGLHGRLDPANHHRRIGNVANRLPRLDHPSWRVLFPGWPGESPDHPEYESSGSSKDHASPHRVRVVHGAF